MFITPLVKIQMMVMSLVGRRTVAMSRRGRAVTMVEYALLAAMGVLVIGIVSGILSSTMRDFYQTIGSHL